jgi:hypothetical protein
MATWSENDRVRVLTGSFEGFRGTVVDVQADRAIVSVDLFGRDTTVTLDADQLGPDEDEGGGAGVREPLGPVPPTDELATEASARRDEE